MAYVTDQGRATIPSSNEGADPESEGRMAPPTLPLSGRTEELRLLRGALNRGGSGESATVVLAGSEGMGKSHLMRSICSEADRQDFLVAMGTAYPMESGVPYALFCDLLDPLVRDESAEALLVLTRGGAEFQFICPSLVLREDQGRTGSPEAIPDLRNRLLWNFPAFLDRLRRGRPLLLVFEDLEWADPSSLELLHFLARRPVDFPLVLLATLDPDGSPGAPEVLDAVRSVTRRPDADLRFLQPLGPEDVVEMVTHGFGVAPEVVRTFAATLCRWTGGNPLFLTATLENLVSTGRLRREGGSWVGWEAGELEPPTSVEALVLDRAERLSDEARSVVGPASVLGPRVRFPVLKQVSHLDEATVLAALDELGEHGILREVGSEGGEAYVTFTHPVLQQVFYRSLGAVRAHRLHGGALEALLDHYGGGAGDHADELAIHVERAGDSVDPREAAGILAAAGRHALRAHADREAVRYLQRARDLYPSTAGDEAFVAEYLRIVRDLARAYQRRGRYEEAAELLVQARTLAEKSEGVEFLASLDRRLGLAAFWAGRSSEALEHWDRGLAALARGGHPKLEARLRLARSACLQEVARVEESKSEALKALRLGIEAMSAPIQVSAHMNLTLLHTWAGPTSEAREHGREALQLAEETGDRVAQFSAHWAMAVLEGLTGHPKALRAHLDSAQRLAEELRSPLLRLRLAEVEIEYAARMGHWSWGTDLAAESIRMARELNQRMVLPRLLVLSAFLHLARGDLDLAEVEISEAWEAAGAARGTEPATVHTAILARAARASLHLARQEFAEAVAVGEEGMELVDRSGYTTWGVHRLLPTIAEASLHLRDLDRAREVAARLRREVPRIDHQAAHVWSDICEALVTWLEGDAAGGLQGMVEGAEALEGLGLLPDAARLRRQAAGRLAELGGRDGAIRELRRVHEILSGLKAEPELEKVRGQFRELGARPPARSEGERGAEVLTEREVEIARLIAERRSNKAVARALGISPRTVGTHLTNIFRKLELDTRWELGDRVREGLLDTGRSGGSD
jgi:DNA-binding CsgD family transcriptional regulator/tetratricopeptide (TPR) repeat protein